MKKLFTIVVNFSDHLVSVGQYESESAENALKDFIRLSESLNGYNRSLLTSSLMPLLHLATVRGVWSFYFDPDLMDIEWPDDNPILGGHIIQTDINGDIRE